MVNGKPGRLYKRDDHTVVFEFPEPNFMFVDVLAGSTTMGGGQACEQHMGRTMGAYMPAHYLKQFHAKHVAKDEPDRKVKAAGFDGWVSLIKSKWDWRLNTELPVLGPWKTYSPINTPVWGLERNLFFTKIAKEIWKILVDGQFSIGTVDLSPAVMGVRIVSNRLGNIPARQVNAQHARTPCSSHPATFFFKA